jgi:hypothetical protein
MWVLVPVVEKEYRNADSDTGDAVAASNVECMDDILPVTIM